MNKRMPAVVLTMSLAGAAGWMASEGGGPVSTRPDGVQVHHPYVPTRGDVPTIGYGSTRYEDGTPVKLSDPPITRERAMQLAHGLRSVDEQRFIDSIPGVELYQAEFDLYLDFIGQFGIGNWRTGSPRKHLLAGQYVEACGALLKFRRQDGRDCSLPENWGPQGCRGVWTRQLERHRKCMAAQGGG